MSLIQIGMPKNAGGGGGGWGAALLDDSQKPLEPLGTS